MLLVVSLKLLSVRFDSSCVRAVCVCLLVEHVMCVSPHVPRKL